MSSVESRVKDQYNAQAQSYDHRWNRYINKTLTFLLGWAEIPVSAHILDVACGTGELERLLLTDNLKQSISGIDISEQMLAEARQKLKGFPNVTFKRGTASQLPFPDRSFDIVVSASSFHYFPEPKKALAEVNRVLKPNGQVIILDWCKDFLLCRLCDWFLKRFDPAHQQCYTEAEFHALLENSGLRVQRSQRMRFDIIWGLMIAAASPKVDQ
ncbi:class I SAM-dependent methyltransferase [cf. Phormidesmis sp. LEGE 11477]|uniref:class I SAM-dependent methyltransferase n=1 Tax=cf. Phormidesmis sp. LEGE 11477 TaxID=1828680 RepID=UPI001882431D|nr:class I SAM-dependent methyltransferase [cf. Phormidesmis sp. LEGE 11477]MBE9060281.1 class I SAM-dependent methyltransferase [cf. Phormidesmis sp. LEGE 11477]